MRRSLPALAKDEAGVAAVEFALILPLLVAMLFGSYEFVQLFDADRRVGHAAAAIADVVAQGRTVTSAQLSDDMTIAPILISPLPTDAAGEQVSSFTADASGRVSIDWTAANNYSGAAPSVPAGYLAANESVIAVDVTYRFKSALQFFLPALTITQHAYARPRLSAQVAKS